MNRDFFYKKIFVHIIFVHKIAAQENLYKLYPLETKINIYKRGADLYGPAPSLAYGIHLGVVKMLHTDNKQQIRK